MGEFLLWVIYIAIGIVIGIPMALWGYRVAQRLWHRFDFGSVISKRLPYYQ